MPFNPREKGKLGCRGKFREQNGNRYHMEQLVLVDIFVNVNDTYYVSRLNNKEEKYFHLKIKPPNAQVKVRFGQSKGNRSPNQVHSYPCNVKDKTTTGFPRQSR